MAVYGNESLERLKKIETLKNNGLIVYARDFSGKTDITNILQTSDTKDGDTLMANGAEGNIKTAGRLITFRTHGKLSFGKIIDNTDKIQLCFVKGMLSFINHTNTFENIQIDGVELDIYKFIQKYIDIGDYIGIKGDLFLTKHGEKTLFVKEVQLLSKAIRPLPEKFHGITDKELIYRQRYLDLIMNEESYHKFLFKSQFIKQLRNFYDEHHFIEIETPVLGNFASGAAAKPFVTYCEDFDDNFYLRISPETNLKKATVGRFEKVVEFARNFRNEGSDPSHLQEFNMVEHYAAYWNFEDNMKFTENMFEYLFKHMNLNKIINVKNKEGTIKEVDFSTPWERIDYIEGVYKHCGIDVSQYGNDETERLRNDIKNKGIQFEGMDHMGVPTLIDYLYKKVLRPNILGPAFVYKYPKTLQPLARCSDENPQIVEQWQLVINGWEIIKSYSELVDPKVQENNFSIQQGAIEKGDEESTSGDDEFLLSMEYGMPPQSGWGMGIERITAILCSQDNLRDMMLFPLMKKEEKN